MPRGVLLSFSWVAIHRALYRRLANTGPLEDFQRLWDIRTGSSRGEIVRRPECREFLRDCHVDQLVKGYPFGFRKLTRFFQERRLQPQRKITLPHDFPPNRSIAALVDCKIA